MHLFAPFVPLIGEETICVSVISEWQPNPEEQMPPGSSEQRCYNERKKLRISCLCVALSVLKLAITWLASDPQNCDNEVGA